MKKYTSILIMIALVIPASLVYPEQSSLRFDYKSAEAMLKVILALHNRNDRETVKTLLDTALKYKTYEISHERYTNPGRSKENQVTLSQFRKFMMSFSAGAVDTQENRRLILTRPLYEDAIENPGKYQKALQKIQSTPTSRFQDAFDIALYWLPEKPDLDVYAWVLFDIGGSGAWAFRTEDGSHNIGFNMLHMLDDKGEFDIDLFLGILAHEIHHLGSPLSHYLESINYENLKETSRLRLYSDYMMPLITEGMAQKFCNNAPGALTPKPYPEKPFAATSSNLKEWTYHQEHFMDIHKHALKDLKLLLGSTPIDKTKFQADYDDYWTWKAGELEGKNFMLGRQYYYGTELMGVIDAALGREALFEGLLDIRKIPVLFNKGIKKLRPKDYGPFLFPQEIITTIQELR